MDNLRRLGSQMTIPIPTDEKGLTGRQCPNPDCTSFFKVKFGTGLKGEDLPCYCPYCGHVADHSEFMTKDQIEYAKSVAVRTITDAIFKDFKKLEFNHKPKGSFGIGFSMRVQRPRVTAIKYYQEEELETDVICSNCALHYAVYGIFAYCPDCATHNSYQVLELNYALLEKQIDLAEREGGDLGRQLTEDALENAVAVFDAFGRELCAVFLRNNASISILDGISFQNLESAQKKIFSAFNADLRGFLTDIEWTNLLRGFQKRHLLSHKLGVVDQTYLDKTDDLSVVVGRRIHVSSNEVTEILLALKKLGSGLQTVLNRMSTP